MNIKNLTQDFYDNFGYWPEQGELEAYLEQNGYFDNEAIPNNISHFNTSRKSRSFLDHLSDEESTDDFFREFKRLVSKIKSNSKQQHHSHKLSEQNLELLFIILVFLNKVSLFFLLRYCGENGIYVDI